MTDGNKAKTDYSSNSSKSKKDPTVSKPNRPDVPQIASGRMQKRSIGYKFRETFAGDDAGSVGQYLLFDVIIPKTKDLLFDMVSQGFERLLFGTSRPIVSRGNGKTNYRGISHNAAPAQEDRKQLSGRARANHHFEDIVLDTRDEAVAVIEALTNLIDMYDSATVSDLYSCVGISTNHTDLKFGWTNLDDAAVRAFRGGYSLDLPRPEVL